jgi:hypothetical protein
MGRVLPLAVACLIALTATAEGAPRRKGTASRSEPKPIAQEQDEFRSCDVAVRDFVQGRREAAALPVKEVKSDGLRMTLNFVHPYGESGDTPPNLSFTRGESIEERRRALNEAKQRVRVLMEAARTGNLWYVIAVHKDDADDAVARRSSANVQSDGKGPTVMATVFANIENRCLSVYEFRSVAINALSPELRELLGARSEGPPQVDHSLTAPPS